MAALPRGSRREAASSSSYSRTSTGPTMPSSTSSTPCPTAWQASPLLVVAPPGPSCSSAEPGWGGQRNAATISLVPLTDADTHGFCRTLLGTPVLPADQQAALLHRAGGTRSSRRSTRGCWPTGAGRPQRRRRACRVRCRADRRLPPDEKRLLQLASVLGKVFWTDCSRVCTGATPGARRATAPLERKEFVRREHRSAVAGSKQYVFVHALVRDGAYGQMSGRARADVHRRASRLDRDVFPPTGLDHRTEILALITCSRRSSTRVSPGSTWPALVPRAAKALRGAG